MRISRPCYDKYHRCPGWAGGGMKYARVTRCDNGRIVVDYDNRWWTWRMWPCNTCDVLVLPFMSRWLAPSEWRWRFTRRWARLRDWLTRESAWDLDDGDCDDDRRRP